MYIFIALIFGMAAGAVLHWQFDKKAAATESEIAAWLIRIRGAIVADEKAAKEKLLNLADDLQKKL